MFDLGQIGEQIGLKSRTIWLSDKRIRYGFSFSLDSGSNSDSDSIRIWIRIRSAQDVGRMQINISTCGHLSSSDKLMISEAIKHPESNIRKLESNASRGFEWLREAPKAVRKVEKLFRNARNFAKGFCEPFAKLGSGSASGANRNKLEARSQPTLHCTQQAAIN